MFLAHVTCATCLAKGAVRDKRRDDFLRALKAKGSETAAIDAEIGATVFTELWDDLSPS